MLRPYTASERLLPGPPYKGCRISSLWACYALATGNESAMGPDDRPKGQAERTSDLKRGWRAFETTGDSNGIPDQGDVVTICKAMFPALPLPTIANTPDFDVVVAHLRNGKAVSIALKLSAVAVGSPLRRYTSADHQVTIYDVKDGETRLIDPMHPQDDMYVGTWVPLADVRKAALAWGECYIEVFPIAGWTAAKRAMAVAGGSEASLKAANRALKARIVELEADLKDCELDANEAANAARAALLDELADWIEQQREAD